MTESKTTKAMAMEALESIRSQIRVPEGFKAEIVEGYDYDYYSSVALVVHNGEAAKGTRKPGDIRVVFLYGDFWGRGGEDYSPRGKTEFTSSQGDFTFDRRGIEDSFYFVEEKYIDVDPPQAIVAEQIKRAQESIERHDRSIKVPITGHVITPERKEEMCRDLAAGKSVTLMPAGFGIGYRLYTGRRQSRYDSIGSKELADFFGVKVLNVQMRDCD